MSEIIFIVFLIIILVSILILQNYKTIEKLTSNIDIYIITLKQEKRIKNIEKQKEKLEGNILLFDAIKGDKLNIDELINSGKVSSNFEVTNKSRKRILGCFLSHLGVYKEIHNTSNNNGYTIVFEDDFNIKEDNFMDIVNKSIDSLKNKNIDFDILFLGNLNNNRGESIIDNIYYIDYDGSLIGMHGYLINNKNIKKIIDSFGIIDKPVDLEIERLSKTNVINTLVLNPDIVNQWGSDYSSINNMNIENFYSYV